MLGPAIRSSVVALAAIGIVLTIGPLILAGCGGDDDSGSPETSGPTGPTGPSGPSAAEREARREERKEARRERRKEAIRQARREARRQARREAQRQARQEAQEEAAQEQAAPEDGGATQANCEPGYTPCVPTYPPDVDCPDVGGPVTVTGSDPHGLDADGDGVGCET
jgi:hypothetical protein